jgi:hypothetical protein
MNILVMQLNAEQMQGWLWHCTLQLPLVMEI